MLPELLVSEPVDELPVEPEPVDEVSPLLLDDPTPASLDPLLRGVRPLRPWEPVLPLEPVALPVPDEEPVSEPVVVP